MPDRDMIIKGCENWVNNHEGEDLLLTYSSVVELLALLKEQEVTQKDGYNLQELWKRARAGETLNETELNFLLADWDERNIFKPQEEGSVKFE